MVKLFLARFVVFVFFCFDSSTFVQASKDHHRRDNDPTEPPAKRVRIDNNDAGRASVHPMEIDVSANPPVASQPPTRPVKDIDITEELIKMIQYQRAWEAEQQQQRVENEQTRAIRIEAARRLLQELMNTQV